MLAVLQRTVVEAFGQQLLHRPPRDVPRQFAAVGAHARIGRAQVGKVGVVVDVARGAIGVRRCQRGVVRENRPGRDLHATRVRLPAHVGEHVGTAGGLGLAGHEAAGIAGGLDGKPGHVAFVAEDVALRVVREDVTRVVVVGREGNAAQPSAALQVIEHHFAALVEPVGAKNECRCVHACLNTRELYRRRCAMACRPGSGARCRTGPRGAAAECRGRPPPHVG